MCTSSDLDLDAWLERVERERALIAERSTRPLTDEERQRVRFYSVEGREHQYFPPDVLRRWLCE